MPVAAEINQLNKIKDLVFESIKNRYLINVDSFTNFLNNLDRDQSYGNMFYNSSHLKRRNQCSYHLDQERIERFHTDPLRKSKSRTYQV